MVIVVTTMQAGGWTSGGDDKVTHTATIKSGCDA
jgi:hypothetical protein